METIAKYAALASSAFIFIPAGRDMISYGTFLLPGEENIRPLMTMAGESARTWMWGMWGFNHCVICLIKILAVLGGDKTMLKLMAANAAGLAAYWCSANKRTAWRASSSSRRCRPSRSATWASLPRRASRRRSEAPRGLRRV